MLVYFFYFGHNKYALEAFNLLADVHSAASPWLAHKIMWRRTVNTQLTSQRILLFRARNRWSCSWCVHQYRSSLWSDRRVYAPHHKGITDRSWHSHSGANLENRMYMTTYLDDNSTQPTSIHTWTLQKLFESIRTQARRLRMCSYVISFDADCLLIWSLCNSYDDISVIIHGFMKLHVTSQV